MRGQVADEPRAVAMPRSTLRSWLQRARCVMLRHYPTSQDNPAGPNLCAYCLTYLGVKVAHPCVSHRDAVAFVRRHSDDLPMVRRLRRLRDPRGRQGHLRLVRRRSQAGTGSRPRTGQAASAPQTGCHLIIPPSVTCAVARIGRHVCLRPVAGLLLIFGAALAPD